MPESKIIDINSALVSYIKDNGLDRRVKEANVVNIYNSIKDKEIYYHTKAYKVVDKELYIKVESPVYANEISLRSADIISRINKERKSYLIHRLKFKLGEVSRHEDDLYKPIEHDKKLCLSLDEENKILSSLSGIMDKDLRHRLYKVFKLILQTRNRRVE